MASQKPSVARMVHFVTDSGDHRAGVITVVVDPVKQNVGLTVFAPGGVYHLSLVTFDDSPTPKVLTWHWPEQA